MSKILIRLIWLVLTLFFFSFFLPKTTQASTATDGNCTLTFYDAATDTEITPNTNMGNLKIKIESNTITEANYTATIQYQQNLNVPIQSNILFTPGTPVNVTANRPSVGWQSKNYPFGFVQTGQPLDNATCKIQIPVSQVASQACNLYIQNRSALTPAVAPILVFPGLKSDGTCYDILVDNKIQPSALCADGKTQQALNTFTSRGQPYTVKLQTQCLWAGNYLGCVPQSPCNPTTFTINPVGGIPPTATQAKCSLSPDPTITGRPLSTLDNIFIQANNLTPLTDYNIWGHKKSDANIYSLGIIKSNAYGNLNFQLFKPTSTTPTQADTYEVRIYNKDNQEPSICSIFYDVNDASKVPIAPVEDVCTTHPEECTKGGGDPCGDARGPAFKTAIGCVHTSPAEFVKDLMTWVLGISGGLAFLMMLLGAFQMLTSAGNPETLNAGRERLTSAVIGLLFVIFAILLLQIIGAGILSIPGFEP